MNPQWFFGFKSGGTLSSLIGQQTIGAIHFCCEMAKASSSRQISEVAAAGLSTKTNRIGRADQNFDTLPPFLKSIDFGAVDRRRDALCFECHRETVDEGNIIARTGVEDIGLGLTTCRRRFGYRWRVEPRVSVEAAERLKFGNLIHFSVQRFWRIGNAKITFTGDSAVLVSKGILFSWKVGCRVS